MSGLPDIGALAAQVGCSRLVWARLEGRGGPVADGVFLYIVRCADGSYYTGTARCGLEQRMAEHNAGHFPGYTSTRRPVVLVFSLWFERITDAIAAERQVKGWSRAKKEALIRADFEGLRLLSKRMGSHPSRRPPAAGSSG